MGQVAAGPVKRTVSQDLNMLSGLKIKSVLVEKALML
jgi:hypothetical protein